MSLSVYLYVPKIDKLGVEPVAKNKPSGIFICEDGATKQISREEWNKRYPNKEPFVVTKLDEQELFTANITHNLGKMAAECGLYDALWRPDENNITKAQQLIEPLMQSIEKLKSDPEKFKAFNPKNGWGNYEGFLNFLESYLAACIAYPYADVSVSR